MSLYAHYRLAHQLARKSAAAACLDAPDGYVVMIKEPTRSLEQNAALWAKLTDIAGQVQWPVDGELQFIAPEDWKSIFTAALRGHQRMAKGIDGGIVMLGRSTTQMGKAEFSELLELITCFGSERGVRWGEP